MRRGLFVSLAVFTLLASACASPAAPASGGPLTVIATYSILGDIVQNVGGDKIQLTVFVGPDGDAHTFEPSPADSAALAKAALLFENGLGFETWLDDLYAASGSKAARIVVTQDIAARAMDEHAGEEHAEEEGEAHEHGEFDPHVWHSVANVIQMTKAVRQALASADAANAAVYQANAEAYIAELQTLDTWIFEQVKALPQDRRKLVTAHDTFGYFADRYGFEIVGTALGAISTEAADPSAADIAALVDEIKAAGMPALFAENVHNPQLMEQVAAEAGVKLAPALYTDALGQPGSEGATYLKMMRYNVNVIVTALGQ
jgi:ABC-type Zn uptake system ZnuABC Zn-binding protein ZnuA